MRYFGTDGIRGKYQEFPITEEFGVRLGKALVDYLKSKGLQPKILLGMDTRHSGPSLAKSVASGILKRGGEIGYLAVAPTPSVAFGVRGLNYSMGVVISASHNPWEYNGFKLFNQKGMKFKEAEEEEIEGIVDIESDEKTVGTVEMVEIDHFKDRYTEFLLSKKIEKNSKKELSLILDCANGATSNYAPLVFGKSAKNLEVVFNKPDGRNINLKCGSESPDVISKLVKNANVDLGICFDGDGDRIIAVDEKGDVLTGDHLLYIFASYLRKKGLLKNSTVITTVMSNTGLKLALGEMGIEVKETDVGDRNVFYKMLETGSILGGEESGHIIFLDRHTTGDGMLSGLVLLEALRYFGRPLSELASRLKLFPKKIRNIRVSRKVPLKEIPGLWDTVEKHKRSLGNHGKLIVRYSGTEPVLRVMVEAEEEVLAEKILEEIEERLSGYVLP